MTRNYGKDTRIYGKTSQVKKYPEKSKETCFCAQRATSSSQRNENDERNEIPKKKRSVTTRKGHNYLDDLRYIASTIQQDEKTNVRGM